MFSLAQKVLRIAGPSRTAYSLSLTRRLASSTTVRTLSGVDKRDESILVNWNKEKDVWSKFHFDWLRDNCPCPKCKHPELQQRLLDTLEDPTPVNVDVEGKDAVLVEWRDGHRSQYSHDWLLTNSYCHNNISTIKPPPAPKRKVTLWDRDTVPDPSPEVNYHDVMADDKSMLALLQKTYQYGYCFVLDTPPTLESNVEFGERIGPLVNSFYGIQWHIELGNMNVNHISYSKTRILPHTDNPVFFDAPGAALMHVNAYEDAVGGGSVLVDGFKLGQHMREKLPEYFTLLSNVSIPYKLTFKDAANYYVRRHIFLIDNDGDPKGMHFNHIDRQPLDEESLYQAKEVLSCDADVAMKKMYQAIRCFHQLLYSDRFTYKFDLRPGRMMMMNNRRVLHAREKFISGYRSVCGVYHSEQEWLSKLEKLENDLS